MLEFFQSTVNAIISGLESIVPSTIIGSTWKNREEQITEYKLAIDHPERYVCVKRKFAHPVIRELPDPRWMKIGKVTNLYMYPLISGKECDADECQITFDETYMFRKGELITWDRSFVVYDKRTRCIMTLKEYPELLKVELSFKNNCITLRTDKMPTLCVQLKMDNSFQVSYSNCQMFDIFPKFTCVDCGNEAAEWLSRFLVNKASNLRLGYAMSFVNPLRMHWQDWNGHESLFIGNIWHGHSLGPFINILPHKIAPTSATNQISEKNKKFERLRICDPNGMIYPTIIISASNEHLQRKWEWIKIGDLVIKIEHPMTVEESFRTFDKHMKVLGLGVNCKLYEAGYVKVNDNVYAHFP